eukprot:CAMPEP_0113937950 /NCGR_PEP_ID=MMETSP1339-20121228/4422_1 /TAXON_ID=94617 /ORGANISM="Fibrocapsa japonica" /LENGTH=330 /DNA_ID=CAMNT_0000940871 /DNA_START=75 /DNA_END=1070 /DNA_ORIENTATION=- /assembly_acc=CAM_ASM_000762
MVEKSTKSKDDVLFDGTAPQATPPSIKVAIGMLIAFLIACFCPSQCSVLVMAPLLLLNMLFIKTGPIRGIMLTVVYMAWLTPFILILSFICSGVMIPKVFFLIQYIPFAIIVFRSYDRHSIASAFCFRVFMDPPLLFLIQVLAIFGKRLADPFASVIDSEVVVGGIPMARDVAYLAEHCNVGLVVNLCAEYGGPVEAYHKQNIKQVRLPTIDASSPSLESVEKGIAVIEDFLRSSREAPVSCSQISTSPDKSGDWEIVQTQTNSHARKRVFIHCKGGQGRAATLAMCLYLSRGQSAMDVFKFLKTKRPVISPSILHFEVVRHYASKNKKK